MSYSTLQDNNLVELLNQGDQLAYAEIYHRYWLGMYMYARKLLSSPLDAEDIVQEVLLDLWTKAPGFTLTSTLQSYLFSCVRYAALNAIDRRQVRSEYLMSLQKFIDHGECITDYQLREKELLALIEQTIEQLPERMREVFELSRKHHLSHKEISGRLGISEKTVKKQISKALTVFRVKFRSIVPLLYCFW